MIVIVDKYNCGHYSNPYIRAHDAYKQRLSSLPISTFGCNVCKKEVLIIQILTLEQYNRVRKIEELLK